MHDDFVANLRLLCSYYPSIAEVCRRLTINRAQFNRYLSGRYRPSHAALQRICHFFGVTVEDIALPHHDFRALVQTGQLNREANAATLPWPNALVQRGSEGMERYIGRYFELYHSMSRPGQLMRTLVCLEEREGGVVYQRTERMQTAPAPARATIAMWAPRLSLRIGCFWSTTKPLMATKSPRRFCFRAFKAK
ncbi:hypothetical protein HORIV_52760 [Vreelandella olivaria]|uniref:HTH cro/C1-type domain-containing protein n=1 Tax=Vreelandella olivaria TaxID=390919 RepID=A0ABN5X1A1_9GAMM|nr:hypothetical protein HORIV_52760 [Halomonas olivaria]